MQGESYLATKVIKLKLGLVRSLQSIETVFLRDVAYDPITILKLLLYWTRSTLMTLCVKLSLYNHLYLLDFIFF